MICFFSQLFSISFSKNTIFKDKKNICGDSPQNCLWVELTSVVFTIASHLFPPL